MACGLGIRGFVLFRGIPYMGIDFIRSSIDIDWRGFLFKKYYFFFIGIVYSIHPRSKLLWIITNQIPTNTPYLRSSQSRAQQQQLPLELTYPCHECNRNLTLAVYRTGTGLGISILPSFAHISFGEKHKKRANPARKSAHTKRGDLMHTNTLSKPTHWTKK